MPHVPAWKRLGLQLKGPAADGVVPSSPDVHLAKKRLLSNGQISNDYQTQRPDSQAVKPPTKTVFDDPGQSALQNGSAARANANAQSEPTNGKRRKSVSFTADVKAEDGSHAKVDMPDVIEIPGRLEPVKTKKSKNSKQNKKDSKSKSEPTKTEPSSGDAGSKEKQLKPPTTYLSYLDQYQNNRSDWKFNKSTQTHLLKDLFNIYRIPSQHDSAISTYIAGLQGEAARERLQSKAQEILSKPETSNDDADTTASQQSTVEQRHRATIVLKALKSTQVTTPVTPQPPPPPTPALKEAIADPPSEGQKVDAKKTTRGSRGRKRRTRAASISSSSSSSSSSDSDSGS